MPTESNREELMQLMKQHGFDAPTVAEISEQSLSTVRAWLMPDRASPRARRVSDRSLSLIKLKIADAQARLQA